MRFILSFVLIGAPLLALAESFVPIAPLPNPLTGGLATEGGVVEYINTLFQFALTIGAVLAVFQIVRGGFTYMTSEATSQKSDGMATVKSALLGLGILLLVTLVLYVINPDTVCIDIFSDTCP